MIASVASATPRVPTPANGTGDASARGRRSQPRTFRSTESSACRAPRLEAFATSVPRLAVCRSKAWRTSGLVSTFVSACLNAGLCVISSASSVVNRLLIASTSIRSSAGFSSTSRTSRSTCSRSTAGADAADSAARASSISAASRSTTRCSTSDRPTASGSGPAITPSSARSASSVNAPRPASATARTGRNAKRPVARPIRAVRPPSSRLAARRLLRLSHTPPIHHFQTPIIAHRSSFSLGLLGRCRTAQLQV